MRVTSILLLAFLFAQQVSRDQPSGDWLDRPQEAKLSLTELPQLRAESNNPKCDAQLRPAQTAVDRLLVSKGWKLGESRKGKVSEGALEVVTAFLQYDGMCRPLKYQAFVFLNDRLVGQLSPRLMDSRTDGALLMSSISTNGEILATFARYLRTDALCCPSRTSEAGYSLVREKGTLTLKLLRVGTKARPTP